MLFGHIPLFHYANILACFVGVGQLGEKCEKVSVCTCLAYVTGSQRVTLDDLMAVYIHTCIMGTGNRIVNYHEYGFGSGIIQLVYTCVGYSFVA